MELDQSEYDVKPVMDFGKAEYIIEELKAEIRAGKLPEGTRLPSERDLAKRFNVSRMTARRALQILEGEGLVTRYPVRGTFVGGIRERVHEHHGSESYKEVEESTIVAEELRRSGSFFKDMEHRGLKPEVRFLEQPALVPANPEIAEHLQLPVGTFVLKRYRLQLADELPYRLIKSYHPADLFSESLTTDIGNKPLFEWLRERHGLAVTRAKEVLIARLPNREEQRLLQISPNAPLVAFDRTVWADGRVVEWANITAVAGLYTFSYEYDIPSPGR